MTEDAHIPTPKRRNLARRAGKLAGSVAILAGASLAFAAFTAERTNENNAATAADLTLTSDVGSATLFDPSTDTDLANWKPGDTETRCIGVTNGGTVPGDVTLRGNTPGGTGLGTYIDMTIERGTIAAGHTDRLDCSTFTAGTQFSTGTVSAFTTASPGLSDGGGPLADGAKRGYRVTWTLQDDQAAQGKAISAYTFTAPDRAVGRRTERVCDEV